jgi:hypothetical protein
MSALKFAAPLRPERKGELFILPHSYPHFRYSSYERVNGKLKLKGDVRSETMPRCRVRHRPIAAERGTRGIRKCG